MDKANYKIRKEDLINKTNGEVLDFINVIRYFLGKDPIPKNGLYVNCNFIKTKKNVV